MSQPVRPPKDAPNVVVILLDDLGFAQFGCYGSDIATPNINRLAAGGLRYNRFHVTALCSPTRAALLTGRNHHAVGMGFLADLPTTHPGYTARIPRSAATLPRVLRDAGYSTLAVGKWHLVPRGQRSDAGPFDQWPLGLGFERYYGFLRGDANQWAPELVRDNSFVEPPARPEQGYHLTEDLADEAIRMVLNQQAGTPGKPFFLYFATGAMHSPHHVERSWADAYSGRFDRGWDQWRDEVFARQVNSGVVPPNTTLTPRPSWVPAWDDLGADERRLYARMHEVYAGFLSHTDAQIGRVIDTLERIGQLDNTLIFVLSDNGASAEGGVTGTANEHRFTHRVRDDLADNLQRLDDWGGTENYPHYAWGWAWAGNTPFRLWKRYTWLGGTRVPFIVHWPKHIREGGAGGQVRGQFAHAIDLLPTVLDACGLSAPESVDGIAQLPIQGASLLPSFTDSAAPNPRSVQYFEMLGSRSIFADGWKATTDHVSGGVMDEDLLFPGSRDFEHDQWSLFNLDEDFSEAHDVANEHPDVLERLQRQWTIEAEANNVLPLFDSLVGRLSAFAPPEYPIDQRVTLYPQSGPVSDEAIPLLAGGGNIVADVEVPDGTPSGVLFAIGDRNGGLAAYVLDGRLTLALALPGETLRLQSGEQLPPGRHLLGLVLRLEQGGLRVEAVVDGQVVAGASSEHTLPFVFQHGGTHLTLGYDRGLPVSDDYQPPFAWNGILHSVTVHAGQTELDQLDYLRTSLQAD
ncbi:sulfatase [Mycobacterium intermedium]|uniref:Sulfatase n=1 Tax=Mycobacterium intermedium TaxID=28445 RepID=A0A1E3S5X1_MYCIE|nr:arylsulfatase [Mycobacterium intermedium]MCV6965443.1 arylsulfatase [Mycobacterium intermedium]ODQ97538.1 sulfatase [Mycobacterium intermedium]OPE46488.1 sulfatase [Mycobacterium intermedium]ORA96706.1 sulfatase [Mycobacterium intermedium]